MKVRIFLENIVLGAHKLDAENLQYLKQVLRLKNGYVLHVIDGEKQARAVFDGVGSIEVIEVEKYAEPSHLYLAIAQIKQSRMEWLIEKATELNVQEVFILETSRAQNNINIRRLEKIAIEAAKQSDRISIPKIHSPVRLSKFLQRADLARWGFGAFNATLGKLSDCYGIIIGPEGGFTESEEALLQKFCTPISLGKNTLRAETAAIAGLILLGSTTLCA